MTPSTHILHTASFVTFLCVLSPAIECAKAVNMAYFVHGQVLSVSDDPAPPNFPAIGVGDNYFGTFAYDTQMAFVSTDPAGTKTVYAQPPPIAPLGISVSVEGSSFAADHQTPLQLVIDNDSPFAGGGDRFRLLSADVTSLPNASFPFNAILVDFVDPTAAVFSNGDIPGSLNLQDFGGAGLRIVGATNASLNVAGDLLEIDLGITKLRDLRSLLQRTSRYSFLPGFDVNNAHELGDTAFELNVNRSGEGGASTPVEVVSLSIDGPDADDPRIVVVPQVDGAVTTFHFLLADPAPINPPPLDVAFDLLFEFDAARGGPAVMEGLPQLFLNAKNELGVSTMLDVGFAAVAHDFLLQIPGTQTGLSFADATVIRRNSFSTQFRLQGQVNPNDPLLFSLTITADEFPEPSTAMLSLVAVVGLGVMMRRRHRSADPTRRGAVNAR